MSGKGQLTDTFIDRLHNYYGIAVRSNVGNLNAMQQNVIATLYHCASNESRFCLQHQFVHIRCWWYRGECTLAACIRFRRTSPSPSVMVWGVIGYSHRSPLVPINGTLNSVHYISGSRSFTNSKRLVDGCRAMGSPPYANHYGW
ncbi:hypothetical protein TNCV_695851 [Trichonephila clavipes]|nr:hypothetical protein TNCV_695851 [Trichonephila clavipes]